MDQATGTEIVRRDGLGTSMEVRHETASAAVAARAQAAVQARYVMAMQRPRNIDMVRVDVLSECRRPAFAKVAKWKRKVGKDEITGFSIRFVEAAVRCMKNIAPEVTTLYDDPEKRIIRCSVVDFESNVDWSQEITVEKTKERKHLREGELPLGVRKNSYGDTVYLLPANDDEVRMKEAALVSKTLRTLGLRLIPGDILDEASSQLAKTIDDADARDPAAARKELVDGFAGMGVKPDQLCEYFGGMPLDEMGPAEREELRGIFVLMREGERWADIFAASPHRGADTEKPKDEKLANLQAKVKGKVESMKAKKKPKAASPAESPPAAEPREPGDES